MNQEKHLSEKKNWCREVHLKKKIPAQAVSEKRKNSFKLKIPPLPHHFSNGPSLNGKIFELRTVRHVFYLPVLDR